MPKILIVGNSSAVINQIKAIRQDDKASAITFFATESVLPYSREDLPRWLAKDIKEAQLHPEHDKFFTENKVEVIAAEKLARISLKRKYLTTESKVQISYDKLILVDTGAYKLPDIKGSNKNNVFHALSFSGMKKLQKVLIDVETIIVTVNNFHGLNTACALAKLGKEVLVCAPQGLLSHIFDDETASLLKQIIEAKGVRVLDQDIDEILGDSDVKAVRLKSGKVIAAQVIIFDSARVDDGMLSESQLPAGDMRITEDIFNDIQLPIPATSFGAGLFDGFAIGVTVLPEGGREYLRFNGPQNIYKKIYAIGDVLVGAVLYNAREHVKPLTDIIINGQAVSGQEEALLEA